MMNKLLRRNLQISVSFFTFLVVSQAQALTEICSEFTEAHNKKIVIFTDGTGNDKDDRTNVWRLYEIIKAQDRDDIVTYYDKGVGNYLKATGGAVGFGLARNVRQAYHCLASHYNPGDQIYLFGFSRGAYTARVLSGLIHQMGILQFPGSPEIDDQKDLVEKMYGIYRENQNDDFVEKKERFLSEHPHTDTKIEVVGVWDTVAALGLAPFQEKLLDKCLESGFFSWLGQLFGKDSDSCLLEIAGTTLYQSFHQVGPQGTRKILHAVSIDERRNAFKIEFYDEAELEPWQTLKQVWFAGVHSDIGGGYEDSDALSNISLNWMIQNLRNDALVPEGKVVKGDFNGILHTSYKGFYEKADPRIRDIKPGSVIHKSVVSRMTSPSLPEPNPEREPDGVYHPVQFEECIGQQSPTLALIENCFKVGED